MPFTLVGGVWLMWLLNYNLSEAVGFIALDGRRPDVSDLYDAVTAIVDGLLPIMWGTGTGWEVMSRIAAPMVGGTISSTVPTLAEIPA